MSDFTRIARLIVFSCMMYSTTPVLQAQDGNNYSDRYRENYTNQRYADEYRDNYRENSRYRSDHDRRNQLTSKLQQKIEKSSPSFYSSVMKSPRRTLNLPSSTPSGSASGSGFSGSSGSVFNPLWLSPPSLLRYYLSNNLPVTNTIDEINSLPIEVEAEPQQDIVILSPSELLFEEGVALFRQKRYQTAAKNFRHLLDINADDVSKVAAYSLCSLAMRDYDTAAEWMNKADTSVENVEDLYVLIQNIYANQQEFSLHLKQLETKLNLNSEDEQISYLLSVMQAVNDRY